MLLVDPSHRKADGCWLGGSLNAFAHNSLARLTSSSRLVVETADTASSFVSGAGSPQRRGA